MMPALAAWMPSPKPGARTSKVVSASDATATSACPTPTVSTSTTSQRAASSTRSACGTAADNPPSWPREAIDRMNTPSSVAWSCIRTRSPSSAPPENGEDGSTASTPTRLPAARSVVTSAFVVVDLPTPGEPVSPTTWACPPYGASAAATSRSSGESFSTSEISRATARGWPSDARRTRSATSTERRELTPSLRSGVQRRNNAYWFARKRRPRAYWFARKRRSRAYWFARKRRSRHVQEQGVALAAAAAQRSRAGATAAPLELEREGERKPCAGHPDRVAERDRTAVHVDDVRREAELLHRLQADGRKRLVDLDQVEVAHLLARLAQRVLDRVGRLRLQRVVRAGDV